VPLGQKSSLTPKTTTRLIERTELGSTLERGFLLEGQDKFYYFLNRSWNELYFFAPYYWAVINIPQKQIFTFTEGDTGLITATDLDTLKKEAERYYRYLEEQGESKAGYGEKESILRKIDIMRGR
jgi:hypothetical protein